VTRQTARHYLIFETAGGFCGIAWNNVGITRFQLPTKSAEAAERTLLRRLPGAERGAPTPEVVEAVAAVQRYFEGEGTDFSGFKLDLGGQYPFFEQIHAAARRVGGAARRPVRFCAGRLRIVCGSASAWCWSRSASTA
jgi:methylated-DNA-[protein]-cysteine S-methyltransferase